MLEKLSNKIIAIGGAVAILLGGLAYFVKFDSPVQAMDKHLAQEEKTHAAFDIKLDSVTKSAGHVEHVEELIEGMLRGECLENPKENLIRQGLIKKCEELGILR